MPFEAFYRQTFPQLVRYCQKVGREVPAEDIAQETMLRAFVHLPSLGVSKPPWAWLKTIALNLVIDETRRRRRRDVRLSQHALGTTDGEIDGVEDRMLLAGFLADLSPPQRAAVRLRYLEERTTQEAASMLAVSGPALKQLLYRARLRLRLEYERIEDLAGVLAPIPWVRRAANALHEKVQHAVVQASRADVANQVVAGMVGLALVVGAQGGSILDEVAPPGDPPTTSIPASPAGSLPSPDREGNGATGSPRDGASKPTEAPARSTPPPDASSDGEGPRGSHSVGADDPAKSGDKVRDGRHPADMDTSEPDSSPDPTRAIEDSDVADLGWPGG